MSAMHTDSITAPYADDLRRGGLWDSLERLVANRTLLRRILMLGGVGIVAIVATTLWLTGGRYVGTDDSYVHAAQLLVSTDVSGLVKEVDVHEGQSVRRGQVLFRIDPLQFQIALDNAKANLQNTKQSLTAARNTYARMLQDIATQAAQVQLDQANFNRYAALVKVNSIAPTLYDQARFTLASAQSTLASLKEQAATQLATLGGDINLPIESLPQYRAAEAQVAEAQRQLDHTVVRAPFDGIVTAVDSLQPGTLVVCPRVDEGRLGGGQHEGNRPHPRAHR